MRSGGLSCRGRVGNVGFIFSSKKALMSKKRKKSSGKLIPQQGFKGIPKIQLRLCEYSAVGESRSPATS